jgi:hypothetical protein
MNTIVAAAVASLSLAPFAGTGSIEAPPPVAAPIAFAIAAPKPAYRPEALGALLERVSAAARNGESPVVMFDLDDTLLDPAYRNIAILREFAAQPDFAARFPAEARLLAAVRYEHIRYNLADSVKAAGVADSSAFLADLTAFWSARFFDNRWLLLDKANAGGVAFVREVLARGGKAVYLTGRWEAMRPGTAACLAANGFPAADGSRIFLMMKPDKAESDVSFKVRAFEEIAKLGPVAGGFENEPQNVNAYLARFPGGLMIFLDTRHSTTAVEPAPGIAWVADFRLE